MIDETMQEIKKLFNTFLRRTNGNTTAASYLVLAHVIRADAQVNLTVPQITKLLPVCQATIRAYIRNGELAATRSTGRGKAYRVSHEALAAFIESRVIARLTTTT